MAMSRKHYREVAEIIKSERESVTDYPETMRESVLVSTLVIARRLATMFEIDNSNFNRAQFLKACGIE